MKDEQYTASVTKLVNRALLQNILPLHVGKPFLETLELSITLYTIIPLMLVRLSFSTSVFLVIFSQTFWLFQPSSKRNSETNDISFESPNIELPESEIKVDVASSRGLPCPLKCEYVSRVTNI